MDQQPANRSNCNSVVLEFAVDHFDKNLDGPIQSKGGYLFSMLTYVIATFIRSESVAEKKLTDLDCWASYANDAVLFEIGCLTYLWTDMWLLENQPSKRERVVRDLAKRFVALFSKALATDMSDVFRNRLDLYLGVIRSGEQPIEYLSTAILRARDGGMPHIFDPQERLHRDEKLEVAAVIGEWLKAYHPVLDRLLPRFIPQ